MKESPPQMVTDVPPYAPALEVEARGAIGRAEHDRAVEAFAAVLARHGIDATGSRMRLSGSVSADGQALVQANLRVHGAPTRIQVPGRSVAVATATGVDRLDRQVRRLTRGWEQWSWPDPQRPPLSMRGEGRVIRHKRVRPRGSTPCQAVAVMNAMDYDVHLFTDGQTGEDAVVYRSGPTGVRLARQRSMHPPAMPARVPLTVNPRRVPVLTMDQATHRLCEGWLPFLFFTEPASGRGNVLYRRYDGNLGLIAPDRTGGPR